ncbi:DNA repair protein RecO [Tannockella kyphosi]|uniref:DNA repair protein RecO n=1 Tax=Tannockella kyphosi TaxID=2899121 RepID=UPI002010F51D|nr:DNA repair protein RecO [Tannockella kyphosi]
MTTKQSEVVEGFVLKSTPYKERDVLLQVYTKEYGKITIHARGIQSPKSKNRAACLTLTLSQFTIIYKEGISSLVKASIIHEYRILKQSIELEIFASFILEYLLVMTESHEPDSDIYQNAFIAFEKLEQGYSYYLIYALFIAFILRIHGCSLVVDGCIECGRKDHLTRISYSGGFVCEECATKFDKPYDLDVLRAFRYINLCPMDKVDCLDMEEAIILEVAKTMQQFLDEFSGINFKTKKFIKSLLI